MSTSLLFWVIMIIWLLFGGVANWPVTSANRWQAGSTLMLWVLLALLGWKEFGPALHN